MSLPDGWRTVSLKEMGEVLGGLTYSPSDVCDSGLLVLRSSNVQNAKLTFHDNVYVSLSVHEDSLVRANDILICVRNGSRDLIGKNALISPDCPRATAGAFMALFRGPYNRFVYQLFQTETYRRQVQRNLGATINSINGSDLRCFEFMVPPDPEREKIAEILTCWDKAIELVERLIDEKTRLAKGLARDLLLGKKRLRQFSKPWVESPIGDLLEPIDRYVDWDDEATYNLVSIRRRAGGMFMRESLKGVDILTKTLKTTCSGDFVIARMQVVHGAMAITPPDFHGAHVSDSYVTCISKDPNRLKTEFFGYLATLPQLWNIALLSSHGVSIEKMTFDLRTFFKHKVRLPTDIVEQSAIIQFLDVMNKELAALTSLRDHLGQQKRGLMQQLLTGKKRVALEN